MTKDEILYTTTEEQVEKLKSQKLVITDEAVEGLATESGTIKVELQSGHTCSRCWQIVDEINEDELCPRCAEIVKNK